jgi:hypothetical protein
MAVLSTLKLSDCSLLRRLATRRIAWLIPINCWWPHSLDILYYHISALSMLPVVRRHRLLSSAAAAEADDTTAAEASHNSSIIISSNGNSSSSEHSAAALHQDGWQTPSMAAAAAAPQWQQQQQHWQQQRLLRPQQQQRVWLERSQLEKSIMACPTLKALAGVVSAVGAVQQLL